MSACFDLVPELGNELRAIYEEAQFSKQFDKLRLTNNGPTCWRARSELERAIFSPWAARWNLTDDWCLSWVATQRIGRWYELDQCAIEGAARWEIAEVGPRRFETHPFRMPGWDPTEKTKDAFKAETRLRLESALEAHCSETEQRIQSVRTWSNEVNQPVPHYVRAPELGQPEHFRWLVAYQLCRASLKSIADVLSVDRHAVQLATKRLAWKMGLSLRPSGDYRSMSSLALQELLKGRVKA